MNLLINMAVDSCIFGLVLPVVFLSVSRWVNRIFGFAVWQSPIWSVTGYVLACAGLVLVIWSYLLLIRAGKGYTLEFFRKCFLPPPAHLVTKGPFSVTRHPMSLGYLMFLLALSLIDGTPGGALIVFPVTGILSAFYLFFVEEKALTRRFAEAFVSYRRSTPFLFPWIKRTGRKRDA